MKIIFSLTLRSHSGWSIYESFQKLNSHTVECFLPSSGTLTSVVQGYQREGFYLETLTDAGCTFSAERDLFESFFGCKVLLGKVPYIRAFKRLIYRSDRPLRSPIFNNVIEAVFFPRPSFELANISPKPPDLDYYHFRVSDLIMISNPSGWLSSVYTGNDVDATIVDTGAFPHPYFEKNDASLKVVPALSEFDPIRDERGHGSGMTSVFLSQAPKAKVTVIKMANDYFSYALPAFQEAVNQSGRLISCSWGTIGFEPQLYLEIANAVRLNKIIIFSSGNGSVDSERGFFSSISYPDVISVGGCFFNRHQELILSDISSSFESDLFEGRTCPDVLGVCGLKPFGQWILMPCEPNSIYDRDNGERDGTKLDDGWFVSSGTSSAAAYVSGIIALGLQIKPDISLASLKHLLFKSAVSVTKGENNMKDKATGKSPDLATGYGFVNDQFIKYLL